jgi:hypothetical protein
VFRRVADWNIGTEIGYRDWSSSWYYSVPTGEFWDSISNLATTDSFHILSSFAAAHSRNMKFFIHSKSLITNNPTIRRYTGCPTLRGTRHDSIPQQQRGTYREMSFTPRHQYTSFKATQCLRTPYRATLTEQYSVAGFSTLRVLTRRQSEASGHVILQWHCCAVHFN